VFSHLESAVLTWIPCAQILRVFYDRLVDGKDGAWFLGFLKQTLTVGDGHLGKGACPTPECPCSSHQVCLHCKTLRLDPLPNDCFVYVDVTATDTGINLCTSLQQLG
jgi:hypothetical protein